MAARAQGHLAVVSDGIWDGCLGPQFRDVPCLLRGAVMRHSTRPPLSTYEQAVWRLAQMRIEHGEVYADDQRFAVQIVADVFWQTEKTVLRDVRKAVRSVT